MMKKRLHELFSISHNERIGIICFFFIMVVIIGVITFKPQKEKPTAETMQIALELQSAIKSSKVDTIKNAKKNKERKTKTQHRTLTASDLEKIETFE